MAKPTKDIMIDLETLATTSNAAVIQIGICYRMEGESLLTTDCINIPPRDLQYVAQNSQYHIDPNTVGWHLGDPIRAANFAECTESGVSPAKAGRILLEHITNAKESGKYSASMWACGIDFDFPILTHLLRQCRLTPNWSFKFVRDFRTLRELFKQEVPIEYKNDHTAERDAINQYLHLKKIREYIDRESGVV